jgi:hypothetical protein
MAKNPIYDLNITVVEYWHPTSKLRWLEEGLCKTKEL